jgi:uncharacterized membrane protein
MHFPASVQKSRSFGLGLGLQIAFAVFVGLAHPAPAAAQLKVCNNTKTGIMVVVSETGYLVDTSVYNAKTTTKGFTAIDAGVCELVDWNSLHGVSEHVYLYAWEPSNPTMSWNGGEYNVYQHCVPVNSKTNFEYHDYEKSDPGAPCGAGQVRRGFFMLHPGFRPDYTEFLNDSTQTEAPKQPDQPLAAPAPGEVPPVGGAKPTGPPAGIPKPGKAVLSTPSAPTGNAILLVTSGLSAQPGGQNPLAGHTFVLMNQSYEAVLASAGIQAPPGVSPVKGYLAACANRQPACQVGIAATNSSTVSGARADASGKAQLPGVPPGTYYFFCLGAYNKQLFKWDFQVQLKPGANSVTLDQHNAVLVN